MMFHWTVQGHKEPNFNGSMVLFFDLRLPPFDLHLRVSRHRLAPDDCPLAPLSPAKLPVDTRSFLSRLAPILIPSTFAEAASDNLFNLFVCIFGLNGLTCSVLLFITSNFGS